MASLADIMVQSQMQATDPNAGPDIAGHIVQGAQLAMQHQELQMKQQQLVMQKQQLHDAKLEKFAQAVEKGQQYSGKAQSTYYDKFLPSYLNSLGLSGEIPADALQHVVSSPEVTAKAMTVFTDWRAGKIDSDTMKKQISDPAFLADVPGTPTGYTVADVVPDWQTRILKGQDENLKDQAMMGKQQQTFAHEDLKDEQSFRTQFTNKVGTDFKPIVADKVHINSALNAGNKMLDDIASGKQPSRQDLTLLATGLATTISKRINPTEFENIMHLPGAENWSIDQWNKWVAGGINPNVLKNLMAAANNQKGQIDQEFNATKSMLESEVKTSRYSNKADSILDPMNKLIQNVPQPAGRKVLPKAAAAKAAPAVSVDNTAAPIQAAPAAVKLKSGISTSIDAVKAYVQSGSVDGSIQTKINEVGLKLGKTGAQVKAMLGL